MSDRDAAPPDGDRRRLLCLLGALGVGGLAGCGGDGGDGATTAPQSTSTTATSTTRPPTSAAPTTATATQASATTTATTDPPPTTTTTTARPTMTEGTAPPAEPAVTRESADAVIAADGSGDFEAVQAAFDSLPPGESRGTVHLYVAAGTYEEKLELAAEKTDVVLVGAGPGESVLTYDDNAGAGRGTTGSASVTLLADRVTCRDLTFENTATPTSQKVAVLAEGDRQFFRNCAFLSHQDTLYARGRYNRQYYLDCRIAGTTDFVFGDASAVFDRCELFCRERASHVTAANTPKDAFGLVFKHCDVHADGEGGAEAESTDLGRPWGPYAHTVYVDCHLGDVIVPEGWSAWSGDNHETAYYAECANAGPGFTPEQRVEWAHVLAPERAGEFYHLFPEWDPLGKDQ